MITDGKTILIEKASLYQNRSTSQSPAGGFSLTRKEKQSDDRVTIKIDKKLWKIISNMIKRHPEWGIGSVSEFIRRAIDKEIELRTKDLEKKIIEINLKPVNSPKDSLDKDS